MKKQPTRPKPNIGGLLSPEEIERQTAEVTGGKTTTGKPGRSFTLDDAKRKKERAPGLTARGRARLTTMLRPDLREKLEAIASNRGISIADVIEVIIEEYLGLK
jgi:hypothetical protein